MSTPSSKDTVKEAMEMPRGVVNGELTKRISKGQCLEQMTKDRDSAMDRLKMVDEGIEHLNAEECKDVLAISELAQKMQSRKIVGHRLAALVDSDVKVVETRSLAAGMIGEMVLDCISVTDLKQIEMRLKEVICRFPSDKRVGNSEEFMPLFRDSSQLPINRRIRGVWVNAKPLFSKLREWYAADMD